MSINGAVASTAARSLLAATAATASPASWRALSLRTCSVTRRMTTTTTTRTKTAMVRMTKYPLPTLAARRWNNTEAKEAEAEETGVKETEGKEAEAKEAEAEAKEAEEVEERFRQDEDEMESEPAPEGHELPVPGQLEMENGKPRERQAPVTNLPVTEKWGFEDVLKQAENPTSGVHLIDVREQDEILESGMIPGALNIPLSMMMWSLRAPGPIFRAHHGFDRPATGKMLVFYCLAGVRAHTATCLARRAGWRNTAEYGGSWREWIERRGPVEKVGLGAEQMQKSARGSAGKKKDAEP